MWARRRPPPLTWWGGAIAAKQPTEDRTRKPMRDKYHAATEPKRLGLITSPAEPMPSSSLMPGKTNMTEFLVRTDCYCRLARELLPALAVAALLATFCSNSYANCSESERKLLVGPHAAAPVPGLADQAHPLVLCNLLPGQTI